MLKKNKDAKDKPTATDAKVLDDEGKKHDPVELKSEGVFDTTESAEDELGPEIHTTGATIRKLKDPETDKENSPEFTSGERQALRTVLQRLSIDANDPVYEAEYTAISPGAEVTPGDEEKRPNGTVG